MTALANLFSTDYGLLSLAVIIGVILIGAWFSWWLNRKMAESDGRGS